MRRRGAWTARTRPTLRPRGRHLEEDGRNRPAPRRARSVPSASLEARGHSAVGCLSDTGCWQVFGLTSAPAFAGFLLSTASRARSRERPEAQCSSWMSFSLTAAGQPRSRTGFPLSRVNTRHQHGRERRVRQLERQADDAERVDIEPGGSRRCRLSTRSISATPAVSSARR